MKFRLFAALLAMPVLLTLSAGALAQATGSAPKTIEVTGHGDSSAKPDVMTLSFAVTSHSDSADECTRNEAEISRRVVDALKAKLGDSAKVSTSDFSFNPSLDYGGGMATPTPIVSHAEEPPATWQFKANLSVFTDSLEPLGDLIETGLAAGATTVAESGVGEMPDENSPEATGARAATAATAATGSLYGPAKPGGDARERITSVYQLNRRAPLPPTA